MREEIERLKSHFNELSTNKKINAESKMLFESMFMLINLLIAIFLERNTTKNSKNSSLPPSLTPKDGSSINDLGAKGKGKTEISGIAGNTRAVENITIATVKLCSVCGNDLTSAKCIAHERRTKIDIVFEKVIEHIDAEVKQCKQCDATIKGEFPADMPGPLQYGSGLKAYVINLLVAQMLSLNRAQKLVKSIIGEAISEATMLKFILRLHETLEKWEAKAIRDLLTRTVMNLDETSFRVNKSNFWIHSYSANEITLKFLHKKRGALAIEAINILPRYGGIGIHDCWASYLAYENFDHGLCGSHLVRELACAIESNNYKWASNMSKLLLDTCKIVSKRKTKKLSVNEYSNLQKNYRNIITRGEQELPGIPEKPNGRRGKIAKSDAHNLLERLKKYETAVLLFAKKAEVPFTNNRAERDLRMSKVKQKVSGCFRTEVYAKAYCRISSYLQTMANKGINPLVAIQMAMAGEFI